MPGLKFYKLDLHTHTPASRCYLHRTHTAAEIVQAALDKGLAGIAVTDHNSADWIGQMQAAAKDAGLVIFPGVEISMEHYHVVALFDPGKDQRHVESLLGAIGIRPDEYGRSETLCTKSIYEVIDAIHELGGLAVLAHIDFHKGAFYEQVKVQEDGKVSVPQAVRKLFNSNYDAVEYPHSKPGATTCLNIQSAAAFAKPKGLYHEQNNASYNHAPWNSGNYESGRFRDHWNWVHCLQDNRSDLCARG